MQSPLATTWRSAIAASLLLLLTLTSTDTWALPGRPIYRPQPARPYRPVERDVYKAPTEATSAESLKYPWLKRPPTSEAALHNAEGSTRLMFWQSVTNSLGASTTDIASAYVLLRVFDDGIVLTTNFLQAGYKDAPVLALKHEDLSNSDTLANAISQLTGSTHPLESTRLKIVLDKDPSSPEFSNLFNKEEQTFLISTASFAHAELYLKDSPSIFALERIDRPKPPPRWAAKLNECCVMTGVPPDIEGWASFGKIPFNRRRAQVVSLFSDSKTSDQLSILDGNLNYRGPREIRGDPLKAIQRLVESGDSTSPVIVIGHTEGSVFRVEGNGGFTVPFDALTRIAKNANRPIFFIGCYTAEHFQAMAGQSQIRDYPPVGTLNSLYPREVVPRLLRAMNEASSMREFTERLSDESLDIWVSNNFLRNVNDSTAKTVRAPIYKRLQDGSKSIVGFLFMYIPCGLFGACK